MTEHAANAFNHSFWRFSLAFYEVERVQEICLRLQDEAGLDVNRLLFACWLGALGRRAVAEHPLWQRVAVWQQDIIQPLRQLRRAQPKEREAQRRLRRLMQEVELKAEQCEQWWLFQGCEAVSEPRLLVTPRVTWDNLLDVALTAPRLPLPRAELLELLRELVALNHPNAEPAELERLDESHRVDKSHYLDERQRFSE